MPSSWYIFQTRVSADAAVTEIAGLMGCPVPAKNCSSGATDAEAQKTETWAVPRYSSIGWAVPVPESDHHRISGIVVDDPPFPPSSAPPILR